MRKNAGKTSAVMQNEDMSMFNAYERENIRRTKAVLDRIEHELRLDRTTAYQVALHEVMAMGTRKGRHLTQLQIAWKSCCLQISAKTSNKLL